MERARSRSRLTLAVVLTVATLPLLPHLRTLNAGYTYDDRELVHQNAATGSPSAALRSFFAPFPPHHPARGLYRPLTALSYAVDRQLLGDGPGALHGSNILLYALTLVTVFFLARSVFNSLAPAAATALFFGLHPVHCEVVDSISGRSELLVLLFSLLALLVFLRHGQRAVGLVLSTICFALALLSKETAMVLPGVLAACVLLLDSAGEGGAARLLRLWPFVVVLAVYLALRVTVLGRFGPDSTILGEHPLATRVWTIGAVFLEYARLLVAPTVLQVDAYYERVVGVHHELSWQAGLGLSLLVCTLLACGLLLRRAMGRSAPGRGGAWPLPSARAFALCGLLLCYLPISHVVPIGALVAERLIYSASFFFVLLVVACCADPLRRLLDRRPPLRWVAVAVGLVVCLLFGLRSYQRAGEWRDSVTLWSAVEETIKDDYRVYNNLGVGYLERGQLSAAAAALHRSLALEPEHLPARYNLGFARMQQGRLEAARAAFKDVVRRAPRHHRAWNSLGVVAARRGDCATARRYYRRALEVNPHYATARVNLRRSRRCVQPSSPR